MVEGTPLLREHAAYTRIEGSNPSISASNLFPYVDQARIIIVARTPLQAYGSGHRQSAGAVAITAYAFKNASNTVAS